MSREFLSKLGLGIIRYSTFAFVFLHGMIIAVVLMALVTLRLIGFIDWPWMSVIVWRPLLVSIAIMLLCLAFYLCGKVLLVLSTLGKETCEETMILYKYLPLKYAELLSNSGCIRIGTLQSYRNTEHGSEIGDMNEGVVFQYSHDKYAKRGDELNPLEEKVIKVGRGMVVENNYVVRSLQSPNCYIFCASLSCKKAILEKLNRDCPEDKYDACVEIKNIDKFVNEITSAFSGQVKYVGRFNCDYIGRKHHYAKTIPNSAIIKDPRYSYQEEVRFIWEPKEKNEIKPVRFTIKQIQNNCCLTDMKDEKPKVKEDKK